MKYVGYFDINGMSPHQAISHLTEKQQNNYKGQICQMLEQNHFHVRKVGAVGPPDMELAIVADSIIAMQDTPAGPMPVQIPRQRLQYTVYMTARPAPKASGLILPGQQNGQLNQITLVPLPDDTDAP